MFMSLLHRLFPPYCVFCQLPSLSLLPLCEICRGLLPTSCQGCRQCGLALPHGDLCGQCLSAPPFFDRTYVLYPYIDPLTGLVKQLKFQQQLAHAQLLGELLGTWLRQQYQNDTLPQIILPVPLHVARLRSRGFNQAIELAKPIARVLQIPLKRHLCQRIRATLPQTELSGLLRKRNLLGAFALQSLEGYSHIALLDDVVTTGHTVNELARLCKLMGAQRVDVWCVARTQRL